MSNVSVQFKRGNTSTLNSTPITDGMIYFNTENQHIYMDNGSDRLEYSNDMSNFMDKLQLGNLVFKRDYNNLIENPLQINHIIGNSYIGNLPIIDTINNLYENKVLFNIVWESHNVQPFDVKTIEINGIYDFYIILLYNNDDTNYLLAKNNSTIYNQLGMWDECRVYNTRKIQISSDDVTNKTTFTFNQYGTYGYNSDSEPTIIDINNKKCIPYKIIGISN